MVAAEYIKGGSEADCQACINLFTDLLVKNLVNLYYIKIESQNILASTTMIYIRIETYRLSAFWDLEN